eukprot:3119888-Rhodomonas_salina.1
MNAASRAVSQCASLFCVVTLRQSASESALHSEEAFASGLQQLKKSCRDATREAAFGPVLHCSLLPNINPSVHAQQLSLSTKDSTSTSSGGHGVAGLAVPANRAEAEVAGVCGRGGGEIRQQGRRRKES